MNAPSTISAPRPRLKRVANAVGLREPNYPKNQWWVAATSAELGDKPVQRWIMGLPVVLYRGVSGAAVALDDRCPHRWAPLSTGSVSGEDIVCGYHGMQFAPDGRCTRVPTQATTPATARVRSYPVAERAPFVWIWTGDPQAADSAAPPPDLPWAVDPARVTAQGYMEVACNYMALKENVFDLSHFGYVHANTLAVTDWTSPPQVERTDDTVSYVQIMNDAPLPAHYGVATGIGCEHPVNRRYWGTYVSPALQTAGVDIADAAPRAPGDRRNYALRLYHATTPIDLGRTAYWWAFSQDYGHGEGAVEKLTQRIGVAFDEDKAILEAAESMVARDARGAGYPEISVFCDQASLQARRLLQLQIEREIGAPTLGRDRS